MGKLERVARLNKSAQPQAATQNNSREVTLLNYTTVFTKAFGQAHPNRPDFLLAPRNECGVPKFVCSTMSTNLLPQTHFHDHETCADFVANFIHYEPLQLPETLPSYLPSPATTVQWQTGDCFDMAQLLCSILIGTGYDAYVVSGYAPKAITLVDSCETPLPFHKGGEERKGSQSTALGDNKYYVPAPKSLASQFLEDHDKREHLHQQRQATTSMAAPEKALSNTEKHDHYTAQSEVLDPLRGKRVHAWVLVLTGKRMLKRSIFIEPTSGVVSLVPDAPYYRVESVWNAANVWVNLEEERVAKDLVYELSDSTRWEPVLPYKLDQDVNEKHEHDEGMMIKTEEEEEEDGQQQHEVRKSTAEAPLSAEEGDAIPSLKKHDALDVALVVDDTAIQVPFPHSWVPKLDFDAERLYLRWPDGQKGTEFRNGRVDLFAPFKRQDGLVRRITKYDVELAAKGIFEACETCEEFQHRKDGLTSRVRVDGGGKQGWGETRTIETFEPGSQPSALRQLIQVDGARREFYFYSAVRLDGLRSRIEIFRRQVVLEFEGTHDATLFRSAKYAEEASGDGKSEPKIYKMKECYRRNNVVNAEVDVAKRTFNVRKGTIKVQYHYGKGSVTNSWRTYSKSGHTVVQIDPMSRPPTEADMVEEYTKLQVAEKECLNHLRESDREMDEILERRAEEERRITDAMSQSDLRDSSGEDWSVPSHLIVPTYDTVRNKVRDDVAEDDDGLLAMRDYLTPFLPLYAKKDGFVLSRSDAIKVRDDCLEALKERLVERANIVQSRLDEENAALSKRQATFQRNRDNIDASDEAEYERFCQASLFRIQILEQRLDRHSEMSKQRFWELDVKLRGDPRLTALMSPN